MNYSLRMPTMQRNQYPKRPYKHFVNNNPQNDREHQLISDKEKRDEMSRMLYDARHDKRIGTIRRMVDAYKKRKRQEKIDKLSNDSNHWSGLENVDMHEDFNKFIHQFRKLYYSTKRLSFREWLDEVEELIDNAT